VPELVQLVHGPDGFAQRVHALLADAGRACFVVEVEGGGVLVIVGEGDDAIQRLLQPLGLLFVADRKFNRMRPSMARVLGLETRSAKEG
jgi:hypothetical protein